jgi:hypothetical protein
VAAIYDAEWKDFDWEHVEAYRDYMMWHSHVDIHGVLPSEWRRFEYDDFHRVVGIHMMFTEMPLHKHFPSTTQYDPDIPSEHGEMVEDLVRPFALMYVQVERAYNNIKQALLAVSTVKQLEEVLPELAKYLPGDCVTANLPVPIELINRVRGLFPPKGQNDYYGSD